MIILLIIFIFVLILWAAMHSSLKNQDTPAYLRAEELHKRERDFYNNPIIINHFKNLKDIEEKYSLLYKQKKFEGPEMDNLIEQCKLDISFADEFISLFKRYSKELPVSYGTFKRLAIIYEKRCEYEKAVGVCLRAIELGFTDNDTMYSRLSKLRKLSE